MVTRLPAITDVSGIVSEVEPLLAAPITLRLYDPSGMSARLDGLAGRHEPLAVVSDHRHGRGEVLSWSVDEAKVADFIAAQNKSFGDERYVDPNIAYRPWSRRSRRANRKSASASTTASASTS